MAYTNTYPAVDGITLLAKDADDQFDLIATAINALSPSSAPGPIGSVTPSTGAFTTLSASSTVSGAGFTARFATPGPIGNTTPSTGAFTAADVINSSTGNATYVATNGAAAATTFGTFGTGTAPIAGWGAGYGFMASGNAAVSMSTDVVNVSFDSGSTVAVAITPSGIVSIGTVTARAGTGTGQPVMVGTLSINTTAVGNVGAGTDDLMTYSLPANSLSANNKGVRVTAWGTTANNANSKTLTVNFGGTVIQTFVLGVGAAGNWSVSALVIRTGASAQLCTSTAIDTNVNNANATAAETDTSAITIKCTGAATTNNDIVQKGMIVEFFN